MECTLESFDNYFDKINLNLHNGYSKEFVDYIKKTLGDKWNFYNLFMREKYIPFTLLGTQNNIVKLDKLPKNNYYIKKRNGSYGRQITITKHPIVFFKQYGLKENSYIIQREINTDTYKNRKYDYRIYLLILKKNNKINYGYYKKYIVRNSFSELDKSNSKFSKITNHHIYSLQELDENFYILSDEFEKDHKTKIEKLNLRVINKLKCLETNFDSLLKNNQFRILGLDYLVEKLTNKIYLLEINTTPGVYYKNNTKNFILKYNKFHELIVKNLNELINCKELINNNWIIVD